MKNRHCSYHYHLENWGAHCRTNCTYLPYPSSVEDEGNKDYIHDIHIVVVGDENDGTYLLAFDHTRLIGLLGMIHAEMVKEGEEAFETGYIHQQLLSLGKLVRIAHSVVADVVHVDIPEASVDADSGRGGRDVPHPHLGEQVS